MLSVALSCRRHLLTCCTGYVRIWHDSENLGSAIIATAIQGHNRHAKQVPGMPALDPGTDLGTPSPLRRINPQPARPGIATTCAAFSHDHHFFSDNDLAPK